jgi:hypothetical protein
MQDFNQLKSTADESKEYTRAETASRIVVLGIDISHESSWRPEHHQYTSSARHLATKVGVPFNDGEGLLAAVVVTLANQLSTGNPVGRPAPLLLQAKIPGLAALSACGGTRWFCEKDA